MINYFRNGRKIKLNNEIRKDNRDEDAEITVTIRKRKDDLPRSRWRETRIISKE